MELFHLSLSPEAYNDWEELQDVKNENLQIFTENDTWKYKWGEKFTSKNFYRYCFRNITPPAPFLWIWKSKFWPKLMFFCMVTTSRQNEYLEYAKKEKY
jgi:hypothetical protein